MKKLLAFVFVISLVFTVIGEDARLPVRVMTDGFNCKEGIIIANQVREIIESDTLLRAFNQDDSTYIILEITSFQDGGTAVINAGFATVNPLQKSMLDYKFTRRLVSKTLTDMNEIASNIVDKVHLIRKN